MKMRTTAIVLAAGQGKRMQSDIHKQYLLIHGKPVLFYCLKALEESFIDEVILVTGKGEEEYCRQEIVEHFGFKKVSKIIEGGKERYHSVINGIKAVGQCDYLFIHDGARPFLDEGILERTFESVVKNRACVAAMPVKDTIKIADENDFAKETPRRDRVWMVQTPQVFEFELIKEAYSKLEKEEEKLKKMGIMVTDDAMVVEHFCNVPVKLTEGNYRNMKITTPEDLKIAEAFLNED